MRLGAFAKVEWLMKRSVFAAGVLAGLVTAGAAQAVTLSVVGGRADILRAQFDLGLDPAHAELSGGVDIGSPVSIFGADREAGDGLVVSGRSRIIFTYLGSEAFFRNRFAFAGAELFSNRENAVGDMSGVFMVDGGLVPFSFLSRSSDFIDNVGGQSLKMEFALGAVFNDGRSVIALLNDAGKDSDFDDLGVRIDVTRIPLPTSAWLFISAMIGLCAMSRGKSAKA
jgi:hypothetical protein